MTMGEWTLTAPGAETRLMRVSGRWGVDAAEELHQAFLQTVNEVLDAGAQLHVDLQGLEDGDLTFFQVIDSVTKSLDVQQLRFMNIPEQILNKAEQAGFAPRHVNGIFRKGVEDVQADHDRG
ncbi:STAS domain-containing protein [Desulfonatronum thioautotrophicum]|uniref:STAS domain-containing protein n=1 Tax=Desulfonatronum thioautotrophicum TaxID=617001 RepID=UPI0005EB6B42|nr:STAS domain-containing protein [Desulfonatronum thioautotrophicum]